MRIYLLLLLCYPILVYANGSGAWEASGIGVTLNQRGMVAHSVALHAPEEVNGVITLIAWRYQLMAPAPAGLKVKLCSSNQCVELDGQSGITKALSGISTRQPLIFVWEIIGRGHIYPPLRIISNQVIVNYQPISKINDKVFKQ